MQRSTVRPELSTVSPSLPQQREAPVWIHRLTHIESPVEAIHLPSYEEDLSQDAEWCDAVIDGKRQRIRFHDYDRIYSIPGLYERLFYEKLACSSPTRVSELLADVVEEDGDGMGELRVLDVGSGNGMVGDELHARGVRRIVGVDIIPEARDAQRRDRPEIYDDYRICDLTDLDEATEEALRRHRLDAMVCVAALGFGDIPAAAFLKALDLVETPAWIAFNLKEDFLADEEPAGFSALIQDLTTRGVLRPEAYRRYNHRLSITGEPLYYIAMIARKVADVPGELLQAP